MTELGQQKTVMIVDDSEIVLAVAQNALESAGFRVIAHPRPAGCIALILQESPDLLLIDVNMPGLNGDTVVKMLGSTQSNSQMTVLLFSSLSSEVLEQKASACRAHGYIRKSESPMDLVRQVTRWLRPGSGSGAYKFALGVAGSDSPLGLGTRESTRNREGSDSRLRAAIVDTVPARAGGVSQLRLNAMAGGSTPVGRVLLVDHEMVTLSEFRRLVISHQGPVEFALSGQEVLRRLRGENPPDVVVLGTLVSPPSGEELLREAVKISPKWRTRFIVIHDGSVDPRIHSLSTPRLQRPVTQTALCGAIQDCLQCAS